VATVVAFKRSFRDRKIRHRTPSTLLSNLSSCDKHGDLQKEAMNMKHAELFEISNKYCSELYLMKIG
jgi:hypothetical protein